MKEKALSFGIVSKIIGDIILCIYVYTLVYRPGSFDRFTATAIIFIVFIANIYCLVFGIINAVEASKRHKKDAKNSD
ncbi:hypothetical protein IKF43_01520 [Candidatus Saccharibacteria bacterium]|nr:hypothetical protein [Candidatus Saccharibacteria bacterium]